MNEVDLIHLGRLIEGNSNRIDRVERRFERLYSYLGNYMDKEYKVSKEELLCCIRDILDE
ncbi:MAG: hypothetical protein ACXABY_35500 [Candidatus Thorarchaeota archaeon]|jgi:hypothetical protein